MKRLGFTFFLLCLCMAAAAAAHSYQQGDIRIGHIWARATAPGATTAAIYAPIYNTGKEADKLIGASSDLAAKIEIHNMSNDNGVMKMQMMNALELDPGKPVSLRPGGMHLMVFGLKKPLKKGDMFPVTLTFEKAGSAKVDVMIEGAGAMSGGD